MKKIVLVLFVLPLLPACAGLLPVHELSPAGRQVKIATAITASETESYVELGTLDCTTGPLGASNAQECEIDLRNQAAAMGAAVLVIESRTPIPCDYNREQACQQIMGRAFKRRVG